MARKPLLKPRAINTKSRRISFAVAEDLGAHADSLTERANALGFDIDIDGAMAEAYRKFLRRIEKELDDAGEPPLARRHDDRD